MRCIDPDSCCSSPSSKFLKPTLGNLLPSNKKQRYSKKTNIRYAAFVTGSYRGCSLTLRKPKALNRVQLQVSDRQAELVAALSASTEASNSIG